MRIAAIGAAGRREGFARSNGPPPEKNKSGEGFQGILAAEMDKLKDNKEVCHELKTEDYFRNRAGRYGGAS